MKIFKTNTHKIILLILVIIFTLNTLTFADNYNPTREEIEAMIDEVALERAVPSVILKSIARVESVYEPFRADGTPKIAGNCIGLMMVNNKYGGYDTERLKYDVKYNIEAGADVLLNKWSMSSYQSVSSVGNMDPNVLENWYFALWAYNGWATSNNPNVISSYNKKYTYQQLIYDVIKNEYNQNINNIDFSYLPKAGKPSRSLVVPTPQYTNSGNIVLYEMGDYVRTDGIKSEYQLRDVPAGKYIHEIKLNQLATIVEGPVLQNGYYWYKVYIDEDTQGWIERNWLLRTGDTEHGRYVFNDITFHWARKMIMNLYKNNIVTEASNFNPDDYITKEDFCILLSKALDLNRDTESFTNVEDIYSENKESEEVKELEEETDEIAETAKDEVNEQNIEETQEITTLPFADKDNISLWAVEYVSNVYKAGLLNNYHSEFKPLDNLSRKEAAFILSNAFEENKEFDNLNINQIFNDLSELNADEITAIKNTYTNGLMSGKGSGIFSPNDYLTRAEAAAIIVKIIK